MDQNQADEYLKNQLKNYVESITKKSKNGKYNCPIPECGSGTGEHRTGAFGLYDDDTRCHCFSCRFDGDIFDLIGKVEGISGLPAQRARAGELFGITIDSNGYSKSGYQNQAKNEQYTHSSIHTSAYTQEEKREHAKNMNDMNNYYRECADRVGQTDYLKNRGLSEATIKKYGLGYDPHYTKSTGGREWKAIIIPTDTGYTARNTDANASNDDRYRKCKGAENPIYLATTLAKASNPIFIVEAELDALSIIEAGGEAVGLGSTANWNKLIELVKKEKPAQPLIIALDNDESGEKAAKALSEELTALEIPFLKTNPYGDAKDANEALIAHREEFIEQVSKATEEAGDIENIEKTKYIEKNSAYSHIVEFMNGIADSANTSCIPTGFEKLDEVLDGGLYEGLYTVGAISSLGKTTFVTQMGDQIAQAGHDVLMFSLEMARAEIMAKSISRLTEIIRVDKGWSRSFAKTVRGITAWQRWDGYSEQEKGLIYTAVNEYSKYANHIYISEGLGDIGVREINNTIEKHIQFTGNTPIIIVDYLQILAPYNDRATDKQNTDKAVLELKRISRNYKIPVIVISSFNRTSYSNDAKMEAFKESGAIEYSSDVLMALQFTKVKDPGYNPDEEKKAETRKIELKILKNRNGKTGDSIYLNYYPMFNYMVEMSQQEIDQING